MNVDDSLGLCKCFACRAEGDVFNLVREHDSLETRGGGYMDAVERAAHKFGDACLASGAD